LSSILKALQKLEEETANDSGTTRLRRTSAGPAARIRLLIAEWAVPLFLLMAFAGSVGGGFLAHTLYSGGANVVEKQTAAKAEQNQTEPAKTPVAASKKRSAKSKKKPDKSEKPASAPQQNPPSKARKPAKTATTPTVKSSADNKGTNTPIRSEALVTPSEETTEQKRPETSPAKPEKRSIPEQMSSPPISAEILEPGTLQLQAISWAKKPENRMAVINNQICREGGKVEGFQIKRINPEAVLVDDGTNTWKVIFRGK